VTVRDDGRGFDPAIKTTGFGLPRMRERAELPDGTLAVHPAPGQWTRIEARFHLTRQQPDAPSSGSPAQPARTSGRAGS